MFLNFIESTIEHEPLDAHSSEGLCHNTDATKANNANPKSSDIRVIFFSAKQFVDLLNISPKGWFGD